VRQADGGEGRQPAADVHLDVHGIGVDAPAGFSGFAACGPTPKLCPLWVVC
jgi:hypothetical protein